LKVVGISYRSAGVNLKSFSGPLESLVTPLHTFMTSFDRILAYYCPRKVLVCIVRAVRYGFKYGIKLLLFSVETLLFSVEAECFCFV